MGAATAGANGRARGPGSDTRFKGEGIEPANFGRDAETGGGVSQTARLVRFEPTFAREQLAKRYDIHVSKETVRGWMIEAGLWESHSRKLKAAHPWRPL
jgi:hypothetical protein